MYSKKASLLMILFIISLIFMFFIFNQESVEIKAKVIEVDNSDLIQTNISSIGTQWLSVRIMEGENKGSIVNASNSLLGQLEIDNVFKTGDTILVALDKKDGKIRRAVAIDKYRLNWELILFLLFVILLLIYGHGIGLKAIFSFIASLFIIWKVLLPGLLSGENPLLFVSLILIILSAIIIFSIAGFTKKGLSAFCGTTIGLLVTIFITVFFGNKLELQGFTSPYAQTLMINHLTIDIKSIFFASVVIGASGAAMDIAMDIAASMAEILEKKPDISVPELIQSGFNVGRAVIGTMTTTLLLAYSGGYLTLLMLFLTKNSSYSRILNYKIVAAEILRTVTGSIGLVMVAPITAFIGAWVLKVNFNEMVICIKKKIIRLNN